MSRGVAMLVAVALCGAAVCLLSLFVLWAERGER